MGAYMIVFLQSHCHAPRLWLGFQPDLTPAILVCAGLMLAAGQVTSTAILTGLWLDSLSANPLGISVLPLFVAGWAVMNFRELILREEFVVQFYLGTIAGAAVPLLQLLLLQLVGENPLLGWQMTWWCLVNALFCGVAVPVFCYIVNIFDRWFSHPPYDSSNWPNENRQIVRRKT